MKTMKNFYEEQMLMTRVKILPFRLGVGTAGNYFEDL